MRKFVNNIIISLNYHTCAAVQKDTYEFSCTSFKFEVVKNTSCVGNQAS